MMAGSCGLDFVAGTSEEGDPNTPAKPCTGYELLNDIALSGSWTPIGGDVPGNSDRPHNPGGAVYAATFEGNGNTISDLRVSRASSTMVGLFGAVGGNGTEVRNVCVSDVNVRGKELVGALVGYVLPGATVSRSCSSGAVAGNAVVGGLVGWNRGTVERSYSEANVTGFNLSDSQGPLWSTQLGGLVGGNIRHGGEHLRHRRGAGQRPRGRPGRVRLEQRRGPQQLRHRRRVLRPGLSPGGRAGGLDLRPRLGGRQLL